ncbi:MAG: DUF2480 family protein [Bacteroidetes bacterium]|nr:DUF2480 family protein [Bacteroidota bacterium]
MTETIVNKVAESGLITLNLEDWFPKEEIRVFDLKEHLFMGLILKEKEFREALKHTDWSVYQNQYVSVTCSADAIIPAWAYMLVASYLSPVATGIFQGTAEEFRNTLFHRRIQQIDPKHFTDQRVVVKGCGELPVGPDAYLEITRILQPVAKSIMYGEPCSTVPIYKKPK